MSFIKAGREAAKHIWLHWGKPSYVQPDDPLVPEFAEGALLEFERLQAEAPGIMQVMAEGAYKGAQQLNLDDYHGIMEVLQNADDLHATDVAVSLLETSGHKELLILHNGEPVSVHHVLAMTYAFISTKTEDPQQKGKFGVGLKTLGRIANRMEVHSNTYSFAIDNQRISKVEPCPPILGFYQPGTRSTLLRLSLLDAFDVDEFLDWFMSLDASILLFLDTVTSFRFIPLDAALEQIEQDRKSVV